MTGVLLPGAQYTITAYVKLTDGEADSNRLVRPVVAIGNFDGVHRGHRAVIGTAVERAREARRPSALLTFEPHPRSFFRPDEPSFQLTSEAAKLRLLAATDLDGAVVLTFNAAMAGLSAEAFVERILMDRLAVTGVSIASPCASGASRTARSCTTSTASTWISTVSFPHVARPRWRAGSFTRLEMT